MSIAGFNDTDTSISPFDFNTVHHAGGASTSPSTISVFQDRAMLEVEQIHPLAQARL
jgi:hypothetical protein